MAETIEAKAGEAKAPVAQPMLRLGWDGAVGENPCAQPLARALRGGDKMYGAFSIEKFKAAASLAYTHDDAQGFIDYVSQFNKPNFWYRDAGVAPWAYYEQYDDWLDTYGMDAVRAVYHSGHGGMDANGVFYAPMGADWGTLGHTALSSQMRLGNECVRYVFWSTCYSCRVLPPHSPIRTWGSSNLGFRMLFGFETTSVDSPDYGKNFWREWNKGKSFSTAWLDASWAIAHDQAPAVAACGATATEAQARVFNERLFYPDTVSRAWWWWRWYSAATSAFAFREPFRDLPGALLIAHLRPPEPVVAARGIIERFGLDMKPPAEVMATRDGTFTIKNEHDLALAVDREGAYDLRLAPPNRANRTALSLRSARAIADEAVRRYRLGDDSPLVFDRIRVAHEAGASADGSGALEGPHATETVVQFRQTINGLPVLTPGSGAVRIAVDNDGTVTSVHSSVRAVDALADKPLTTTAQPPETSDAQPVRAGAPRAASVADYEHLLAQEWARRTARWALDGALPLASVVVPGSTEVGYDFRGNEAIVVARRLVEVDFGNELFKRYWVTVPLFE